jgi:hypothetical protein
MTATFDQVADAPNARLDIEVCSPPMAGSWALWRI